MTSNIELTAIWNTLTGVRETLLPEGEPSYTKQWVQIVFAMWRIQSALNGVARNTTKADIETLWEALHMAREELISDDDEWDEITTQMAWLTEALGLERDTKPDSPTNGALVEARNEHKIDTAFPNFSRRDVFFSYINLLESGGYTVKDASWHNDMLPSILINMVGNEACLFVSDKDHGDMLMILDERGEVVHDRTTTIATVRNDLLPFRKRAV